MDNVANLWAQEYGLALSPLFEAHEDLGNAGHRVLLDGGLGSFAISETDDEIWRSENVRGWIWSSDIPHHVTVTRSQVAVTRWDGPCEVFGRREIENRLKEFYRYICLDRVQSSKSIVDHLLLMFRKIRSLAGDARIPDERSIDMFLGSLAKLIDIDGTNEVYKTFGVSDDVADLLAAVNQQALENTMRDIKAFPMAFDDLSLFPALSVRHAGGLLFQEAHFELLRTPSIDLFGEIGTAEVKAKSRGGSHFTPPALARIIVEIAFEQIENISDKAELTICDPACGSGAFLHEAVRTLRRSGFKGKLTIIGSDISGAALAMARFTLAAAKRDWQPKKGMEIILNEADSLNADIPAADIIFMNPPFVSWGGQSQAQRDQLVTALSPTKSLGGDYSMAFITRAIDALKADGVLGALFPASLLSQQAAAPWRDRIATTADLRFIASLNDYGLFSYALVQVACAVFKKSSPTGDSVTRALVAMDDPLSTGEALRSVRKGIGATHGIPIQKEAWSLFSINTKQLTSHHSWRLIKPTAEKALRSMADAGMPKISAIFDVKPGIKTGDKGTLLLNESEWSNLPRTERVYFKKAITTSSIRLGEVTKPFFVFFPYKDGFQSFDNEVELEKAVPNYYQRYLVGNKENLSKRADIVASGRSDWWGLSRVRAYEVDKGPRLVSKYFSGPGGFVLDEQSQFIPVTGFAWFLKSRDIGVTDDYPELDTSFDLDILAAYNAIFNSSFFAKILSIYSPHVSGGQFDLSPRYVNEIYVPDIGNLLALPEAGGRVSKLAVLGRSKEIANAHWDRAVLDVINSLYGSDVVDAI